MDGFWYQRVKPKTAFWRYFHQSPAMMLAIFVACALVFPFNTVRAAPVSFESSEYFQSLSSKEQQAILDEQGTFAGIESVSANKWLNSYATPVVLPDTSHVSGAFTYEIPLKIPPGRNGLEPNLSLSYASNNLDAENIVGAGWSLNIPSIERMNKSGIEDMYLSGSSYFISSLEGELGTTTSTTFMAKSDGGPYRTYTYNPASSQTWTMIDKFGTKYTFGTTTTARVVDPSDSTRVYRWMLEEVRDVNGNYIKYEYTKDNNQAYPSKITYTGNSTTDGPFEVSFVTESRTDSPISYKSGFQIKTLLRIDRIDVKIEGALVQRYDLAYTTGDNGVRSLLSSITETGYDEGGTPTALPATTFQYQTRNTVWNTNTNSLTPDLTNSNGQDSGFRVLNYRRNGLSALILSAEGSSPVGWEYNYGSDTWDSLSLNSSNIPKLVDSARNDLGSAIADVNGDLFPDILFGKVGESPAVHLWTNGGIYATTTVSNAPYFLSTDDNDRGTRLGDFNGDGYADHIVRRDGLSDEIFLNNANGTGWGSAASSTLDTYFASSDGSDYGARVIDLNGDGLDDVIQYQNGDSSALIRLNKGSGQSWDSYSVASTSSYAPPHITDSDGADIGTRTLDINADGFVDFVVSTPSRGIHFYLNRGDGVSWLDAATTTIPYFLDGSGQDIGVRILHGNVDGVVDFVESSALSAPKANHISAGDPVDVLTQVTSAQGATTVVTYTARGVDTALFPVTKTVSTNAGLGAATSTITYSFLAPEFKIDYQNRKFRGFGVVLETDSANALTETFYHQGNGNNINSPNDPFWSDSLGEYNDVDSKMYLPYQVEKSIYGTGNIYSRTIYKVDRKIVSNTVDLVFNKDALTLQYDGDGDHKDSAVTSDYATSTGNLISRTEWGEVSGSADGTFSDTGTDKRTTAMSYAVGSSKGVIGLPSAATSTDNGGATIRAERHYYDGLALGLVDKGNETKTEQWKTGTTYINSQQAYNVFGLVASSTDPRGKVSTYVYDSRNLYVATSTNPLSQATQFYYDYTLGKPKTTIDPNGRVFQTTYDGLDRPLTESQPDIASPGTLVTKKSYSYTDTIGSRKIVETNFLDGSTDFTLYTYLDGLDRVIQTRKEAEDGNYSAKDFVYNTVGLLDKETLPYFSSGSSRTAASGNGSLYSIYTYDPLWRITNVATAVGNTGTAYDQWTTTVTDALGNFKDFAYDAFGRLASVVEHDDGNSYTTSYTYSVAGDLTKITDADANVRNFTYDGLGRRLTAQDLHDAGDGTFGTWTYVYDDAGNLASTTDPKSQLVNYAYDNINRVISEDFTGLAGVEVQYGYDACAEGIGRLCTATSTGATTKFTYNALGLPASEQKTINNTLFTTSYSYNRQGSPTAIVYPDNSEVQYTYNTAGLTETIAQKESGGSFANLVSDFDYAPTEKVNYKLFGNGVQSTYTYNPDALYRLTNILTTASTTGGGGMGFVPELNPWRNLARAVEELPLALRLALDLPDELPALEDEMPPEEEQSVPPEEVASLTPPADEETETPLTDESASTTPSAPEAEEAATSTPLALDEDEETATTTEPIVADEATSTTTPETAKLELSEALLAEDALVNPYIETSDRYEFRVVQTTADVGEAKIELLKDRPEIRLKKWNGEVDVGVRYDGIEAQGARAFLTNRMEWKDATEEVHAYPLPAKEGMEDDGFEFEVVLNEKPESNIFNFSVSGADDLDFFYQPALDAEKHDPDVDHCTETQCVDKDGNITRARAENVIGSYAVYHKTKKDYQLGGANYGTGKAFHIYRPKAVDADGNETWGTLSYVDGNLSVEVPQEFLDKAVYPVAVDPTFGYTSIGATATDIGYTTIAGILYTGAAGTLDSISAAIQSTAAGDRWKFALYRESDDVLIAPTAEGAGTMSLGWSTLNTTSNPSISSTGYIISRWGQPADTGVPSTLQTRYDSTGSAPLWFGNGYPYQILGAVYPDPMSWSVENSDQGIRFSIYATYTSSNQAPTAPTSLLAEGQTNPADISDSTPDLSAIYNDPDTSDIATHYQIQVATSSAFTSTFWDSGQSTLSSSTPQGNRSPLISYVGPALASSTQYYWRVRFFDTASTTGAWSTATSTFSLAAGALSYSGLQNIAFTYDAVGNITQIADTSSTTAAKTVLYGYDDLYRLTTASTTNALSTPYSHAYTYSKLGNITSKTGQGAYTYAETNYANPHAPTSINGQTLAYDNNGNLTSYLGTTNTWDYRNRLTKVATTTNTFFAYDHTVQRVQKGNGIATTTYPSKYINYAAATTTKHVFTPGGELVATLVTSGGGSATDTGNKTAGGIKSSTGWANFTTTRLGTSDNSRASCNSTCDNTDNGQIGDFTFNVPSGATINGIEVLAEMNESVSSGNIPTLFSLSWNNGTNFTSTKTATVDGTTDANYTLGNSTDTWGRTWTDTELNNTNFRLKIDKSATSDTLNVDYVRVKVWYTTTGTASTTKQYIHTDHLGGTNVVTGAGGDVAVQVLDFYPYGTDRINSGSFSEQKTFIGEDRDPSTNLSYLNARYYNPAQGQFLSQDPVFWENQNLENPQSQNSYSYVENNPIIKKDPTGRFGILALFAIGALTNVGLQGFEDLSSGAPLRWQNYAGAAIGGVAGTAAFLSTGSNPFAAGAIAQGTEEYTSQWLSAVLDGNQRINYGTVALETGVGGVFGGIGLPGLKGVTAGRNSMQAITNQIGTKLSNGTIKNFTVDTASKILTTQFVSGLPQAGFSVAQSSAISSLAQSFGVSSLSSAQTQAIEQVRASFSK